jgi:hypothetical protein
MESSAAPTTPTTPSAAVFVSISSNLQRIKQAVAAIHILRALFPAAVILVVSPLLRAAPPQISQDRDLLDIDITKWDCANRLEGTAKTPDAMERNRLKNRSLPESTPANPKSFDNAGFLKYIGDFDAQTKGKRRKDLLPAERQKLEPLQKEVVQLTGYIGLAYAGPPESTNCGNVDYHDWHLEIVEKPPEHAPQIGDPTSIICEITPRTQNAIFRDHTSIQALAGFFRRFDLEYESTGHKAQKVRITGFLLWDDEHNGTADVGTTIQRIGANKYHNPWRRTAWEIHPVIKIERLDNAAAQSELENRSSTPPPIPVESAEPTTTPAPSLPPPRPQIVTITQAVKIKIPYGETIIQRGVKLPVLSHDAQTVTVKYMGQPYVIPIGSTDLR